MPKSKYAAIRVKLSDSRSSENTRHLCHYVILQQKTSLFSVKLPSVFSVDACWPASSHRILVWPAEVYPQSFQIVNIHRCLCSQWRCEAFCLTLLWVTFMDTWQPHVSEAAVAAQVWGMRDDLILVLCVKTSKTTSYLHIKNVVKLLVIRQTADEFALTETVVSLNGLISRPLFMFNQIVLVLTSGADSHVGHLKNWLLVLIIWRCKPFHMALQYTSKSCAKLDSLQKKTKSVLKATLIYTYSLWPWQLYYLTMSRQRCW